MRFEITKAIVQENHSVEPHKYYAYVGEKIYRILDKETDRLLFFHTDKDGLRLFCSQEFFDLAGYFTGIFDGKDFDCTNSDGRFDDYFEDMVKFSGKCIHFDYCLENIKAHSENPIVVGGCGRSGTTLLLSILGSHSNIYAFDEELYCFTPRPCRLNKLNYELNKANTTKRWCEKTPKNILVFREIYELFNGNVKLIHMVRDGRDVVTSEHPNHKGKLWVDTNRWVNDVSAGLKSLDISYLVKYEDLVTNTEDTLKNICEYIEEPFEKSLLNYQHKTTVENNPAWETTAQQIHSKRVGRWKKSNYSKVIDVFLKNKMAVELMKYLGYIS